MLLPKCAAVYISDKSNEFLIFLFNKVSYFRLIFIEFVKKSSTLHFSKYCFSLYSTIVLGKHYWHIFKHGETAVINLDFVMPSNPKR